MIFLYDVGMKTDLSIGCCLAKNSLNFAIKAWKFIGGALEHGQIVEHRFRTFIIAFAGNDDADAGRINQSQRGGDAVPYLVD